MNSIASRVGTYGAKLATLLGTVSLLTLANAIASHAQGQADRAAQTAQNEPVPETVLITGSLIRGTAPVGAPVTNFARRTSPERARLPSANCSEPSLPPM